MSITVLTGKSERGKAVIAARQSQPGYWKKWNQKRDQNVQRRAKAELANTMRTALRRYQQTKNDRTLDLLGAPMSVVCAHIEAQFLPGMSWENSGQWHYDHIRPCASFDLSDPEQQKQCFHYTNLQPLWAADNIRKSDTWEPVAA